MTIKVEVEKLLKLNFNYLVPLIECVSNPISVDTKKGTIRVCTNFHNLNKACPKDSYPVPFIN